MFSVFGALALCLAVVGLYGLEAYTVARRPREIGIRMALGASAGDTVRMVLREGVGLTVVGMGVGAVLAAGLARLLSGLLYEVGPLDPLVFTVAPAVLAATSLLACHVPARRAARVEPLAALRCE